jgi:hypothetical protein
MTAPDIEGIVEGVRVDVAAARARGEFTPEDIEMEFETRRRAYAGEAGIDPRLGALLWHDSHDWNIDSGYVIRTTRPGLIGAVVKAAKKAVRPIVRLYTDHIVNRQAQLNLVNWYFMQDAVRRALLLELEVRRLRHELDVLKRHA